MLTNCLHYLSKMKMTELLTINITEKWIEVQSQSGST